MIHRAARFIARLRRAAPRPSVLSIEPTNRCNLNCPFCLAGLQNSLECVAHSRMPRPFGRMDMGLYRKIVCEATAFGITNLQLHFQGEPLLHPDIVDMARMAKAAGLRTNLFTNGMLLTTDLARSLMEAGLADIRFSVDGATAETYAVNRVGGDFETVMANMRAAVGLAREKGSGTRIVWQFIVLRNNEHEIEKARAMAADMGVQLFFKTLAVSVPELVPENPAYRRRMNIKPCRDIYRAIFAYWNGDVVICCYDQAAENVLGNLESQSLEQIWNGRPARRLRRRIDHAIRRPADEPPMCRSCLKWSHHPWKTSDGLTTWAPGEGASEREDEL